MYINLSEYYFNKCAEFADAQLKTSKNLYAYRGEHREDKIRKDIIIGKLGEVAAYKYLKVRGFSVNKPDFSIYEQCNKSFAADLITDCGRSIHVKSQGFDSMVRYGASWLLQKSDALTYKPEKSEFILMVSISGLEADVLGVVNAQDLILNGLYDEPKISRYAKTKVALYFDTIKQAGISLDAL